MFLFRRISHFPVGLALLLTLTVIVIPMTAQPPRASADFTETTLDDELTIIHEKRSTPPIVAVRVFVPAGSSLDPDDKKGLAQLTARVLASRTEAMSMIEFNRFKSRFGLKVNSSVYPDFTEFSFTAIEEHREKLLEVIDKLFSVDSVSDRLFKHLRQQQLSSLASRHDRTYSLAIDRALEEFYGNHPYSHPPVGRTETVRALDKEDVQSFFNDYYTEDGSVVSSVGALSLQSLTDSLRDLKLPANEPTSPEADFTSPSDTRLVLERKVDQPTHLKMFEAPRVTDNRYVSTKVLDAVLGGGMSSRLFVEMREKRSLGYQTTSSYPSRRLTSNFRVFLGGGKPDGSSFDASLDTIWDSLRNDGPSEEELRRAQDYLTGNFKLNHETMGKKAWYRGFYEILGRGAKFDDHYPERINETSREDVKAAVKALLDQPGLFLTIQPKK